MATKKRKSAKRRHASLSEGGKKRSHKKRRRMSAGTGMSGIFKMVSDPLIGGIAGGIAAVLIQKIVKKAAKDNEMIAAIVPVAIGFLIKKKAPAFAAALIAVPALSLIKSKVKFLSDDGAVNFVNDRILSEPLLLSSSGRPLILGEENFSYSINDDSNENFELTW